MTTTGCFTLPLFCEPSPCQYMVHGSIQTPPCLRRILRTWYQIIDHNDRVLEVEWERFCWTSRVHFTGGEKSQTFSNTHFTLSHTLCAQVWQKSCLFCLLTRMLERLDPSPVELMTTLWKCKWNTSVDGVGRSPLEKQMNDCLSEKELTHSLLWHFCLEMTRCRTNCTLLLVHSEWKNRSKYCPPPKIFFCH